MPSRCIVFESLIPFEAVIVILRVGAAGLAIFDELAYSDRRIFFENNRTHKMEISSHNYEVTHAVFSLPVVSTLGVALRAIPTL